MLLGRLLGLGRGGAPRAATPENPRFDLNSPQAWDALAEGDAASSGVRVTRDKAMTYAPWWRGVNLISRGVAKAPLMVYDADGAGRKKLASRHPAYRLLRWKPNGYQTSLTFRRQLTAHALVCGNGYAYIDRLGDGSPAELLPIDPDTVTPTLKDGALWYVVDAGGVKRKLPSEDVLHLMGFSHDGFTGVGLIGVARDTLGFGMASEKFQATRYKSGARPSVVLEAPAGGRLTEQQVTQMRESWERMHSGLDNAHKTALLNNGITAKVLSFSSDDMQWIEAAGLNIRQVANLIGLPPHKLGDTSRTSYSSLEQENMAYLDDSLDPWLSAWEYECRDKLLTEDEKASDDVLIEHDCRKLVRASTADRANYNRTALGGRPWITQNEARAEDGLDPLEDQKADQVLEPMNMGGGGADNGGSPPAAPSAGPGAKALRRAVRAELERLARRGAA